MGYARLEAEGLIVGTAEWNQRQKEKATDMLRRILNADIEGQDIGIVISYENPAQGGRHIENIKESYLKEVQEAAAIY